MVRGTTPTPCHASGIVEVSVEALAGGSIRQPLSRESRLNRDADVILAAEGNIDGRDIARSGPIPRGQRPRHVQTQGVRSRQTNAYRRREAGSSAPTA